MIRQLSADVCNRIVGMRQAGSSQKDIAHVFRITQGSVSKILKRHPSGDWSNESYPAIWSSQENHS